RHDARIIAVRIGTADADVVRSARWRGGLRLFGGVLPGGRVDAAALLGGCSVLHRLRWLCFRRRWLLLRRRHDGDFGIAHRLWWFLLVGLRRFGHGFRLDRRLSLRDLLGRLLLRRDLNGLRLLGRLLLGLARRLGLLRLGHSSSLHFVLARRLRDAGRRGRADHDLERDDLLADARERRRLAREREQQAGMRGEGKRGKREQGSAIPGAACARRACRIGRQSDLRRLRPLERDDIAGWRQWMSRRANAGSWPRPRAQRNQFANLYFPNACHGGDTLLRSRG